mmetsp:Transcript_885/g.1859  ORF Transcript_885/g.1859 Transcript_885/m.1859 type:complete len:97 (-) Transcript_885:233-523(-)|eukprot:CAMPEP_0171638976 /NCGR_PEP_ID=MMETSP0990-20121206/29365_1 /TAXON_ID=483369 /ORGANISM="non described non described, Strain CCMP2098" /LENGTH=96 /DNA_ID=CAMNT_0012212479 /DNA_START=27 /DNA_END=317 /DNA_ORIENTATION=-
MDMESLIAEQQARLNKTKVDLRVSNEEYLGKHPELQCMISLFMKALLEEKPDDCMSFACRWFIEPEREAEVMQHVGGIGFDMGMYSKPNQLPPVKK